MNSQQENPTQKQQTRSVEKKRTSIFLLETSVKRGFIGLYTLIILCNFANLSCSDTYEYINQTSFVSQPYTVGDTLIYVEATSLDTQKVVVVGASYTFEEDDKYASNSHIYTQRASLSLLNLSSGNAGWIYFYSGYEPDFIARIGITLPFDTLSYSIYLPDKLSDYSDTATIQGKFNRKVHRDTALINSSAFAYKVDEYYETIYNPVQGCLQITDFKNGLTYYLVSP